LTHVLRALGLTSCTTHIEENSVEPIVVPSVYMLAICGLSVGSVKGQLSASGLFSL
jgi:hypothetical protein